MSGLRQRGGERRARSSSRGSSPIASVVGFDGRLLTLNLFYLGWIALFPFSAQVLEDHGGDTGADSSSPSSSSPPVT